MARGGRPSRVPSSRMSPAAARFKQELGRQLKDPLAASRRRWEVFSAWAQANHLRFTDADSFRDALLGFVAACRTDSQPRLMWSTIQAYVCQILTIFRLRHGSVDVRDITGYLADRVSLSEAGHAHDISLEEALRVVVGMPLGHPRTVASLMVLTGLRSADARRLYPRHIVFHRECVSVDVRRTKNIRTPGERRILTVPLAWLGRCQRARLVISTLKEALQDAPFGQPVSNAKAPELNVHLRAAADPLEIRGVTTYSLRRCFLRGLIDRYRRPRAEGMVVDWNTVVEFSLHFKDATLRAYYDRFYPSEEVDE